MSLEIQSIVGSFRSLKRIPRCAVHSQNVSFLLPVRPDFIGCIDWALRAVMTADELLRALNIEDDRDPPAPPIMLSITKLKDGGFRPQVRLGSGFDNKFPLSRKFIFSYFEDKTGLPNCGKLIHCVSVPLYALLATAPPLDKTYTVYAHTFTNQHHLFGAKGEEPSYIGITRNGWVHRWKQHEQAARAGSHYRFHEALRRFSSTSAMFHEIICCGTDLPDALRIEEGLVDYHSLYPNGFNMVPGGNAGIAYLARKGVSVGNWEHHDREIDRMARETTRAGIANPLMAALWRDDDYAASVICANPNNFTLEKVRDIRMLVDMGYDPEAIATRFGFDVRRVRGLVLGNTYSRVK